MKVATNQERLNELFDSDSRSLTSIAEELGVTKQAVSMWRSGVRSPKKSVLVKIAQLYNVSIEWLMGFDVPKENPPEGFWNNYFTYEHKIPIVVPDSERFVKLVHYMPEDDYQMVMHAFERAEKRLREEEDKGNDQIPT